MPITISRTQVFGLVSDISCSSLSGRFSSVLCIWRSSSLWLEAGSLALLPTLCCMSQCSLLQDHLTHLLFQFVCNLGILVSGGGGAHSIPRRSAWLSYPDQVCILRAPQCFVRFCMAHLVRFFSLHCLTSSKLTIVYRVVLTFMLLIVIIQGIMGVRRGEGVAGPMVEVWAKGKRSRGTKVNTKVG